MQVYKAPLNDYKFLVKDFLIKVYEKYVDFSDIIINDTNYKDQLQRYLQNRFNKEWNNRWIFKRI